MLKLTLKLVAGAATLALVAIPVTGAQAKDSDRRPRPTPTPTLTATPKATVTATATPTPTATPTVTVTTPASADAIIVEGLSISDVSTPTRPREYFGMASVYATWNPVNFAELTIAVKPVGGTWTKTLDFAHFRPSAGSPLYAGYDQAAMPSSSRQFPAGTYEAHVAYRTVGSTVWVHDEVSTTFTVR